jgi:hypothetical protein
MRRRWHFGLGVRIPAAGPAHLRLYSHSGRSRTQTSKKSAPTSPRAPAHPRKGRTRPPPTMPPPESRSQTPARADHNREHGYPFRDAPAAHAARGPHEPALCPRARRPQAIVAQPSKPAGVAPRAFASRSESDTTTPTAPRPALAADDHQHRAADGGALVLGQQKQSPARRTVGDSWGPTSERECWLDA